MTEQTYLDRFRTAVRIKTDWPAEARAGDKQAEAPLLRFQGFLAESYPAFNKAAERFVLSPYSVVYHWPAKQALGKPDSRQLAAEKPASGEPSVKDAVTMGQAGAPVLFLAHYDVVPVEREKWTHDPFDAEENDGFIYGRGTLDMKSILISALEAVESLCAQGFKPKRDVWFSFGGDEERTGTLGAQEAAKWFEKKGIRFGWILDEGTMIGEDQIKGVDTPLALVSIEEKGYLSLSLTVRQAPGHASRPPKTQAAAILGRALDNIGKHNFPFALTPTVEGFFSGLAPYAKGVQSWAMKHARLLGALFFNIAGAEPTVASLLRTTVAITQLSGSSADNVMPSEVRAVINLRLLPPWTVEEAIGFIKKAIGDERVEVAVHGLGTEPVPCKPEYARKQGAGWEEMRQALEEAFPGVPILPFLMTATTDSRHYQKLADGIFRFSPQRLNPQELSLIHGHDERISIENLESMRKFYAALFALL